MMQGFKMKRHFTLLLCAVSLAIGIVWGRHLWPALGPTSVHARAPESDRTEELYKELDAESGFLIQAGDHLTKVASLTTPSVVHLQSQRQMRGRQVEETGSGIIMRSPQKAGVFVVSNRHVVSGSRPEDISIRLSAPDGRVLRPIKIWMDKDTDVAVLQV
ncbi:MAG: peptidase S1, partial [Planctomycetaceae bacterium]